MNSFAHYAYGAVVGWMFQHVGGILETSPGFATVRIEPKWNAELKFAKTRFDSVCGPKWCYPMGVPARPGRGRGLTPVPCPSSYSPGFAKTNPFSVTVMPLASTRKASFSCSLASALASSLADS